MKFQVNVNDIYSTNNIECPQIEFQIKYPIKPTKDPFAHVYKFQF